MQTDGVSRPEVEVLEGPTAADVAALARLLPQVSSRAAALTAEGIGAVLATPATRVVVVRLDGAIVGMALLLVCTTFAGRFGLVEEVAVDAAARGRHLSVHLMTELLRLARELGLDFVDLTSRPSRLAANNLYEKLGFELRETNCYRHRLESIRDPW